MAKKQAVILVSSLPQIKEAIKVSKETGIRITFQNSTGTIHTLGLQYIITMFEIAKADDYIVDCADHAPSAIAACRYGVKKIAFNGTSEMAEKISDIAKKCDVKFIQNQENMQNMLDIANFDKKIEENAYQTIKNWLEES